MLKSLLWKIISGSTWSIEAFTEHFTKPVSEFVWFSKQDVPHALSLSAVGIYSSNLLRWFLGQRWTGFGVRVLSGAVQVYVQVSARLQRHGLNYLWKMRISLKKKQPFKITYKKKTLLWLQSRRQKSGISFTFCRQVQRENLGPLGSIE